MNEFARSRQQDERQRNFDRLSAELTQPPAEAIDSIIDGNRLPLAGRTEDSCHQFACSEEAPLQIVVCVPPGFPKLPQFRELTEAGIERTQPMSHVLSILTNHVHKTAEALQQVRMFVALGQQPGMKGADGSDVPSGLFVQNLNPVSGATHILTRRVPRQLNTADAI